MSEFDSDAGDVSDRGEVAVRDRSRRAAGDARRGLGRRGGERRGGGHARPSWSGVRLVAGLELRQRIRTSRWYLVLAAWVLAIYGVVLLTWFAMSGLSDGLDRGVTLYSMTTFVVLGFGLLVVPALTATSINGDRERGVLATLQVTQLSAADLVLGKLLAAWAVAGSLLLVAAPVYVFSLVSGVNPLRAIVALGVLALVLAVFCAIGLAFSALTARTVSSVVLTYLVVALLTVVNVLLFGLLVPQVRVDEARRVYAPTVTSADAPPGPCTVTTQTQPTVHTERIAWLLVPNPFVVVSDAAPATPGGESENSSFDPLQLISMGARLAQQGPKPGVENECWNASGRQASVADQAPTDAAWAADAAPVWPAGLAVLTLLGLGAGWIAVRRTTTPVHRLPRDVRIA